MRIKISWPKLFAISLVVLSSTQAPAREARRSGATAVSQSPGFQCGSGMSYKMDGGQAKCAIAIAAAPTGAACAPQVNYASGACRFDVPGAPNGGTVNAPNKTGGYTGVISMTCTNGSWGGTSVTCVPDVPIPVPCAATTFSAGSCSYNAPATADGASVTPANSTPGYTGSISALCTSGAWSTSGASCTVVAPPGPPCAASTVYAGACAYSLPATISGNSAGATTSTPGYSGSITGWCTAGAWSTSGASCAPTAPPPPASPCPMTVAVSGACSYNVPGTSSGSDSSGFNTTPGYTGTAILSCWNGTWTLGAAACFPIAPPPAPCAGTVMGSGACSYSVPATTSGTAVSIPTSTTGYTGSYSATCSAGAWTGVSITCNPAPPPACSATTYSSNSCDYPLPATPSGSSVFGVLNVIAGFTGSVDFTCSSGSWIKTSTAICDLITTPPAPNWSGFVDSCGEPWRTWGEPSYDKWLGWSIGALGVYHDGRYQESRSGRLYDNGHFEPFSAKSTGISIYCY
ncbi:hypothetical protein [Rhodoferax sp.]|uniref:hypothetical protein n=1 Tax=Rhodoferax sp. TaxID=50421 RepID=UPI00277738D2|nr:hypothetical protein [Rhodoferax sp.]